MNQPVISEKELKKALAEADLSSLMLTLVHLTGDMDIIRGDIRPKQEFLNPDDGVSDQQRASVLDKACLIIQEYFRQPKECFVPGEAELREMFEFLAGQKVADDYAEFLKQELSIQGEDPYAQPEIFAVPEDRRADFQVLIIGAGLSGMLSGIRLKEAGISFQILEKNADVGGTWFENTYPGCRVDSANHAYSYSFRPQDWPQYFSSQKVLLQYCKDTADEYGLRAKTRFNTEVSEARFDEKTGLWQLLVVQDGKRTTLTANAVISAVGQLNRPRMPDIPGAEDFAGPSFHSSRWEHQHDFAGKRIGIIGTGASAFQFAPILADEASQISLFQRTPPWIVSNPVYFEEIPEGKHWLLRQLPFYAKWFRFSVFWRGAEGLLHAVQAEDGWNRPEESVSPANQMFRDLLIMNLKETLAGREDLIEKCTPDYPPGAKRILIDDGRYLRSLRQDNVALITEPIERITKNGIRTKDGAEHEFDILVYGTGFKASSFLFPMKIYGREGRELQDVWAGTPKAFKGITIPGFPNFFCCYGPNTNIVVNGSIIFFSECEVRYILGCIALLLQQKGRAIEVRQEVSRDYNQRIEAGNRQMAWGQSGVNTWYKNREGKITQNWPFTMLEFWQQTRKPDPADYQVS